MESLKENQGSDQKKYIEKNIEDISINKNTISLQSSAAFDLKEKETIMEKLKLLDEKNKFLQNENNELMKELSKKVHY